MNVDVSLSVTDFKGQFEALTFVDTITALMLKDIPEPEEDRDLDLGPFERLFSAYTKHLEMLKLRNEDNILDLTEDTKNAEQIHKNNLQQFNHGLTMIISKFRKLDQRISTVSHTAVRIGHSLETVDQQKERTIDGKEIIQFFIQFNQGDPKQLPPPFDDAEDIQSLYQAAEVIQKLQSVSQDLRVKGTEKAQELIAAKSSEIENKLLDYFEKASTRNDLDNMKQCATVLLGFRGQSVIRRYIYQAMQQISEKMDEKKQGEQGNNDFQSALNHFYKKVLQVFRNECNIITQVFPNSYSVMKALLDRIFAEKIEVYIENALAPFDRSKEEYLNTLLLVHQHTTELVEQLQAATESTSSSVENEINFKDKLDGLFLQYRNDYPDRELFVLNANIHAILRKGFDLDYAGSVSLDRALNIWRRKAKDDALTTRTWILASLDSAVVDNILKQNVVSIMRCDRLSDASRLPEVLSQIFTTTLTQIIEGFFQPLFQIALELLPEPDPKTAPDDFIFQVIKRIDSLAHKIEEHFREVVSPRLSQFLNAQTILEGRKRELLGIMESSIVHALQTHLFATISYASKILQKQKSADYKPKDEAAVMDVECSEAIIELTDFLTRQYYFIAECLQGKNLDNYLLSLGTKFYRDVREVQECVRAFHLTYIDELFDRLRALVNLFGVAVENIGPLLREDKKLSSLDSEEIIQFVKLRMDFSTKKSQILNQIATYHGQS